MNSYFTNNEEVSKHIEQSSLSRTAQEKILSILPFREVASLQHYILYEE